MKREATVYFSGISGDKHVLAKRVGPVQMIHWSCQDMLQHKIAIVNRARRTLSSVRKVVTEFWRLAIIHTVDVDLYSYRMFCVSKKNSQQSAPLLAPASLDQLHHQSKPVRGAPKQLYDFTQIAIIAISCTYIIDLNLCRLSLSTISHQLCRNIALLPSLVWMNA